MKKLARMAMCFLFLFAGSLAYGGSDITVTLLKEKGGRVDWSLSGNNKIAFDKRGPDGYYDIWTMDPDGSNEKCVTCKTPGLPQRHNGNPSWHPSGKYIVFQSEKPDIPRNFDAKASPNTGLLNDIWLVTADGKRAFKLYESPLRLEEDIPVVINPHFSRDGSKLYWGERMRKGNIPKPRFLEGRWALKKANFIDNPYVPRLEDIKEFHPGKQWDFYEGHDFSGSGPNLVFAAHLERYQKESGLDIYEFNAETEEFKNLTKTGNVWDDCPHYTTDGSKIVWVSNDGYNKDPEQGMRTEFWIMDVDGSNKRQLTRLNDPSCDYYEAGSIAADSTFSPDSTEMVALVNSAFSDSDDPDGRLILIQHFN